MFKKHKMVKMHARPAAKQRAKTLFKLKLSDTEKKKLQ